MVYKSINNLAPKYLCNLFTKNSSRDTITLRNSELDLYVPSMHTKNGQKSFSYRAEADAEGGDGARSPVRF